MWAKLDDQYADHPKIVTVGPLAAWLNTCAIIYCNRYLTDGHIPARVVRRLVDWDGIGVCEGDAWHAVDVDALVTALVTVGLWSESQDGYIIHDYLEYNPTAEQVKQERQKAAERQAEWRKNRNRHAKAPRNGVSNDFSNGVTSAVSSPSPSPSLNLTTGGGGAREPQAEKEVPEPPRPDYWREALKVYHDTIGFVSGKAQADELGEYVERLQSRGVMAWWPAALKVAADANVRKWSYVRSILDRCLSENRAPDAPREKGTSTNGGTKDGRQFGLTSLKSARDASYAANNTPDRIAAAQAEWDRLKAAQSR